jgi:hypothetical protein
MDLPPLEWAGVLNLCVKMANVHPWFADTTIEAAAGWTTSFFADTDVRAAAAVSNTPQMYIAETGVLNGFTYSLLLTSSGWPSVRRESLLWEGKIVTWVHRIHLIPLRLQTGLLLHRSQISRWVRWTYLILRSDSWFRQIFLDTFVCQANKNGTKYFHFPLPNAEVADPEPDTSTLSCSTRNGRYAGGRLFILWEMLIFCAQDDTFGGVEASLYSSEFVPLGR